jgi:hypothetical protein
MQYLSQKFVHNILYSVRCCIGYNLNVLLVLYWLVPVPTYHYSKAGSLKMNTALEYSTRVVQEGVRRCKKSTFNDLVLLTSLRIPLMNPPPVLGIRIRTVRSVCFWPPGSGFLSHKYGSGSFHDQAKIIRKTLISSVLWLHPHPDPLVRGLDPIRGSRSQDPDPYQNVTDSQHGIIQYSNTLL